MKKQERKDWKRYISLALVFCMLVNSFSSMGIIKATEAVSKDYSTEADGTHNYNNKEDSVVAKTFNSTTFLKKNGMKELIYHGANVRYMDENGNLIDYDPTFVKIEEGENKESWLTGYAYENKLGDTKQYVPEKLTEEKPIVMQNGRYEVRFRPIFETEITSIHDKEDAVVTEDTVATEDIMETEESSEAPEDKNNSLSSFAIVDELSSVELEEQNVINAYDEEQTIKNTAVYGTKDSSIKLKYTSLENGLKETIVLNQMPSSNVVSYELNLKNAVPVLNEETSEILIYSEDMKEKVGCISAPFMNDATGEAYSEEISYQLSESDNKEDTYILNMIISEEYLTSPDRVYPVEIDPTITWNEGSKLWDVYVCSGAGYRDTNFYSDEVVAMAVGKSAQQVYRTYLNFYGITPALKGYYVDSAKLTLYETGKSVSGQTIQAHRVKESWNRSKITWNTRAGYSTTPIDSIVTKGTVGAEHVLDLTKYARNIANETYANYGILLKGKDEAAGSFAQFYSARNSNVQRRPKLKIAYYDGPNTASTVEPNSRYLKKGNKLNIRWEGINSKSLSYVQYRVAKFDDETKTSGESYIPYSASTKIGTTASGSKTISESADWEEGCYKIFVRGVDTGGIAGTGKGASFHIDSTAPSIESVAITPKTSSTSYSGESQPSITWKGIKDNHYKQIMYSIDGGTTYEIMSSKTNGTFKIPAGKLLKTGRYSVKIKVMDHAGNEIVKNVGTYYYDKGSPSLSASLITPSTNSKLYSNINTPEVVWHYSENLMKEVQVSVNSSDFKKIGTEKSGSCKLSADYFTKKGEYKIRLKAVDTAGHETISSIGNYYYDPDAKDSNNIITLPEEDMYPYILYSDSKDSGITIDCDSYYVSGDMYANGTVGLNGTGEFDGTLYGTPSGTPSELEVVEKSDEMIDLDAGIKMNLYQNNPEYSYAETKKYTSDLKGAKSFVTEKNLQIENNTIDVNGVLFSKDGNIHITTKEMSLKGVIYAPNGTVTIEASDFFNLEGCIIANRVIIKTAKFNAKVSYDVAFDVKMMSLIRNQTVVSIAGEVTDNSVELTWTDNEKYDKYKIMLRYGKDEFKPYNGEISRGSANIVLSEQYSSADIYLTSSTKYGDEYKSNILTFIKYENVEENADDIREHDTTDVEEMKNFWEPGEIDTDQDALSDAYEIVFTNTDPENADTDGDGIDDYYEVLVLGSDPHAAHDKDADLDGDGLTDYEEYKHGTLPNVPDSDLDGISDKEELANGTNPLLCDTDKDGISDFDNRYENKEKEISYNFNYISSVFDVVTTTYNADNGLSSMSYNFLTGNVNYITGRDAAQYYLYNDGNQVADVAVNGDEVKCNTFAYSNGQLVEIVNDSIIYSLEYDENENNTSYKIAGNEMVTSEYEEDSLKDVTYASGDNYSFDYIEDENEKIIYANNEVAYKLKYDDFGNIIQIHDVLKDSLIKYEYSDDGILESITCDDKVINYNTAEKQIEYIFGDETRAVVSDYISSNEYYYIKLINQDTFSSLLLPNGDNEQIEAITTEDSTIIRTESYGEQGNISSVKYEEISELYYQYDENSNLIQITSQDGVVCSYEYNEYNQLIRENNKALGVTIIYTYENNGNMTSKKTYTYTLDSVINMTPLKEESFAFENELWTDQLTSYNGNTISYNEMGLPYTYKNGETMSWANVSELSQVQKENETISYQYNYDGYRTNKSFNGKETTYFLEKSKIVCEKSDGETIWYIYDDEEKLLGIEYDGLSYYYLRNAHDDITGIVDTCGKLVVKYEYDAYGKIEKITGSMAETLGHDNPFRYAGYYYDNETGFYYLQTRYYDPETGRFLSPDQYVEVGGIGTNNLYSYCKANPILYHDKTGETPHFLLNGIRKTYDRGLMRDIDMSTFLLLGNGLGFYKAFHEIAQCAVSKTLYKKGYKTKLEVKRKYKGKTKYADVVGTKRPTPKGKKYNYVWEVKPITYWGDGRAYKQLKQYLNKSQRFVCGPSQSLIYGVKVYDKINMGVKFDSKGGAYYYFYKGNDPKDERQRVSNADFKKVVQKGQAVAIATIGIGTLGILLGDYLSDGIGAANDWAEILAVLKTARSIMYKISPVF